MKISEKMKNRLMEALIAAITAFIAAITTTSCLGRGPFQEGKAPGNTAFRGPFRQGRDVNVLLKRRKPLAVPLFLATFVFTFIY